MDLEKVINEMTDEELRADMKALIRALYEGQAFQMGKMLSIFREVLESKGVTEIPDAQKMYNLFYAATSDLMKEGRIKRIKKGIYYLNSEGVDDEDEPEDPEEEVAEEVDEVDSEVAPETQIIGSGKGEVYLYYYPSYAELAKLKGESSYRCKIGMTNGDHQKRFASARRTEEPEKRRIALVIKTDHPADVERLLHASLKLAGKTADAPGKEWFITNPAEITELYNCLVGFAKPGHDVINFIGDI